MSRLSSPWLYLPARLAHQLAPIGLELSCLLSEPAECNWRPLVWNRKSQTFVFPNRLGVAAGVDKNAESVLDWRHMGAGFIEVGTITPRPQSPNPGRIIDRSIEAMALWNKMGFPNAGAKITASLLREALMAIRLDNDVRPFPILANIGKNRVTSLDDAHRDYIECIDLLMERSFGPTESRAIFVINISSPNTTGLRDLFQPEKLRSFLGPIADRLNHHRALGLLKLSPDLDDERIGQTVETAVDLDLDGFVTTNTTLARSPGLTFPEEGGVSGLPLKKRSRSSLEKLLKSLGNLKKDRLVVAVGGVMSPEEVQVRLEMGADLVEAYSALVFEGPGFFKSVSDWMNLQA